MAFDDELGLRIALENAKKSYAEGGVPIGAALIYHGDDAKYPRILGAGHNQRIQRASATLHGETAALENAGRLKAEAYRSSTMVRGELLQCSLGRSLMRPTVRPPPSRAMSCETSTHQVHHTQASGALECDVRADKYLSYLGSPCSMCTGAILLYRIPRVVIGENVNFKGEEDLLRERGVEVIVLDDRDCKDLMASFIRERPKVRTSRLLRTSRILTPHLSAYTGVV